MKTLFLTNEYPPAIYGGAGVHVDYLSRELAKLMEVDVRAFGNQLMDAPNLTVRGFSVDTSKFGCPKNQVDADPIRTKWFPGGTLNYAERLLRFDQSEIEIADCSRSLVR